MFARTSSGAIVVNGFRRTGHVLMNMTAKISNNCPKLTKKYCKGWSRKKCITRRYADEQIDDRNDGQTDGQADGQSNEAFIHKKSHIENHA